MERQGTRGRGKRSRGLGALGGIVGLVGVGLAACFHPLTPFVVGPKGEGEDDEGEDGKGELHKSWVDQTACFMGEDSLRMVRRATPPSQKRNRSRSAVSMKPATKTLLACRL